LPREDKKGVRNHITLLRAPTLAAFLPWGNSEGASCMTLTGCKNTAILEKCKELSGKLLKIEQEPLRISRVARRKGKSS